VGHDGFEALSFQEMKKDLTKILFIIHNKNPAPGLSRAFIPHGQSRSILFSARTVGCGFAIHGIVHESPL
jgi:hypothetical protein